MGRTQSRSQSKSSSSRKTIVKTTTVVKATTCHDDESRLIGDCEVRAILARGLTIEIAMQLMNIYNCGIKRLLRIYKCRKTPLDDAVQKAQTYVSRSTKTATQKKPKPPPKPPKKTNKDGVIHWIGDDLDAWVPNGPVHGLGFCVQIETKVKNVEYPAASHVVEVQVTNVYDVKSTVKRKVVTTTNVVGVLKTPLRVFEHKGPRSSYKMYNEGQHVYFYMQHVLPAGYVQHVKDCAVSGVLPAGVA